MQSSCERYEHQLSSLTKHFNAHSNILHFLDTHGPIGYFPFHFKHFQVSFSYLESYFFWLVVCSKAFLCEIHTSI